MFWLITLLSCSKAPTVYTPAPSFYPVDAEMTMSPDVTMGTLDNGLTYYILPHPKPAERVELRLALKAGSLHEADDQLGLAHFLEHMAFNGTESFPKNSLIDYMESIGMSFGAHINALTSFDRTIYKLRVPTDTEGALEQALLILKEQAGNQLLLDEDINAERGVVLEEWRSSQGSMSRIQDDLLSSLLGEQYAKRLPIGTKESLETFDPEALRRFYDTWYRPDLMSVIAVGDVDPVEMEALIRTQFGVLPKADPMELPRFAVEDHADWKVAILQDKEISSAQVSIHLQENIENGWKYSDYRRLMLQNIVTQVLQTRLLKLTMQEAPPFLSGGVGSERFSNDDLLWSFTATTELDHTLKGLEALLEELERWKKHGITEGELTSTTEGILKSLESAYIDKNNRDSSQLASELVRAFVYNEAVPGLAAEREIAEKLLSEITKAEVDAFARTIFEQASPSIQFVLPDQENVQVPNESEVLALIEAVSVRKLKAPKDENSDFHLMDRPEGGEIVHRDRIEELDVTIIRFSNDVELWYKPTTYGDRVYASAFSYGGATQHTEAEYRAAMLSPTVSLLSGMGDYSIMELDRHLNAIDANVSTKVGDFVESIGGESSGRHLEYMFQYMWNYFERPRFSKMMLNMLKRNVQNQLENANNNPNTIVGQGYQALLWGDHYRQRTMTQAELDAINIQDVERLYRSRFENPADFTFFVVGNFDVQELETLATAYIGTMETSEKREERKDDGLRFITGDHKKIVYAGESDKASVKMRWHGNWSGEWEARNHLQTMASVLEIRLRKRLREELGGVYSVSVNESSDKFPIETYYVTVSFGCDPQRVDELQLEVEQIVANMMVDPPTADEMNAIRERDLQGREERTASSQFWLDSLVGAVQRQEDPLALLNYNERVNSRTPEDIQQMAQRVFQDQRTGSIIFMHLPENMKPTE